MKSLNLKHFGKFYLIQAILITIEYWIFRNVNPNTDEMLYSNISAILVPPIIFGLMIYTYKSTKKLSYIEKFISLFGLLIIDFIWTFLLNYFNLFDRIITQEDIINGILAKIINLVLIFIICLPIIGLVKSKIETKNVC